MSTIPRPLRLGAVLAAALAGALVAGRAQAVPPTPLDPTLFAFPGSVVAPASAASAGLALADRWLGDEPFANPAVAGGWRLAASGTLLRVDRQDLGARNRNFDQTPAFFDGAGVTLGLPALGRLGAALYACQPVLRRENTAYTRGTATPNPVGPTPAAIETEARMREQRAGLALSAGLGPGRVGLGVEWTRRKDRYQAIERSGDPGSGTRSLEFSGDAVGFQAGASIARGDTLAGALELGVGVRHLPALRMDAPHAEELLALALTETLSVERAAGWEMGVSARYRTSPAFRLFAAVGGRTSQRWEGFDLTAGRAWEWKLAGEFHDPEAAWTIRFGVGQERQSDVPEPRTDVLSLGAGWRFASVTVDFAVLHRTLHRAAAPNSFDDRLLLTIAPR